MADVVFKGRPFAPDLLLLCICWLLPLRDWEQPSVINTDKAPSHDAAIAELKEDGKLGREMERRQVKFLNSVVDAGHGKLKQQIWPVLAFKNLKPAYATTKRFEVTRPLRKGQASAFNLARSVRARPAVWSEPLGPAR